MLSVTKIFRFEAAHAISGYHGSCREIHGHSYEMHITVTGSCLNENDMLIDFKELKKAVESVVIKDLDHALILKHNQINVSATQNMVSKICWLDGEPTAEFLLDFILRRLQTALPDSIEIRRIRLYETNTCYAEWEMD